MDWLWQTAIIVGIFILRLGAPLAITVAVGYWLRRLDTKWQAEALAWRATNLAQQAIKAEREAKIQAKIQAETKAEIDAEPVLDMLYVIEQPCWVFNQCPKALYCQCPAYQSPNLPCWMARYRANHALPAKCYTCELFTPRQPVSKVQLSASVIGRKYLSS